VTELSGAFEKFPRAVFAFVTPVRMEQLVFHWTDVYETLYLNNLRKSVEAIQV
jgi:hypothetical protein